MMNLRPIRILLTFAVAAIAAALSTAHANIIDLSGGSNWLSTDNGVIGTRWTQGIVNPGEGVPATAPYGNTSTTTLNKNKMMWYCGGDGSLCTVDDDGNASGDGPIDTFYLRSFYLKSDDIDGALALIADDFLEVWLNGQFVFNGILEQNQTEGQPDPFVLTISDLNLSIDSGTTLNQADSGGLENILQVGWNTLAIRAMDGSLPDDEEGCVQGDEKIITGGTFCNYNRAFEYLFVSGSVRADEPASLALLMCGLLCISVASKRRH
ncbi:hypothetical protein [Emcibacter sp.]|uniref:hypothetical protein n=1 Tax=Emcibacter sp. TaxID=1979954 RepID=UPI002AA632F7|nr:hypothetical protein [Emcibacter sp.]